MPDIRRLKVVQVDADDTFEDMVRVHKKHRPFSEAGQVVLVSMNGRTIPLVARGAKGNNGLTIGLDSKSRDSLSVTDGVEYDFTFSKADFLQQLKWAYYASAPMPRIGVRLALLSVVLGAIGFILGLISLCK